VRLAYLACQSLIAEAELTPKPGLVDRRGAGAHTDLSLSIMKLSALAIEPYFREMAFVSEGSHPSQALRERLALIGREAEHAMFKATKGSNSHKGAIWILGLLVSAAVFEFNDEVAASQIAATAKEIASFADRATPRLVSHGDIVTKKYGVTGARGEALRGFPHVVDVGLPTLRAKRASGATEGVHALSRRRKSPRHCKGRRCCGGGSRRQWNRYRQAEVSSARPPAAGVGGLTGWKRRSFGGNSLS
jgi:triphosphoribosyl-dephospho-CoA synthase